MLLHIVLEKHAQHIYIFKQKTFFMLEDYLNHHDAKVTFKRVLTQSCFKVVIAPTEEMRLTVDFPINSTYAEEQVSIKVNH